MPMSFDEALVKIRQKSKSERQKGERFEYATAYFLENDPLWAERFVSRGRIS